MISQIDNNISKLNKKDPKFYSMVISPPQRELKAINNDPEKLRQYVREIMKDYARSFHRNKQGTIDDIKYYATIEHVRTFKDPDIEIRDEPTLCHQNIKTQKGKKGY